MLSQADVGQDGREKSLKIAARNHSRWPRKSLFSGKLKKFQKNKSTTLDPWARPSRQSLAGIFGNCKLLAFHCHWSSERSNRHVQCPAYTKSYEVLVSISHCRYHDKSDVPLGKLVWACHGALLNRGAHPQNHSTLFSSSSVPKMWVLFEKG